MALMFPRVMTGLDGTVDEPPKDVHPFFTSLRDKSEHRSISTDQNLVNTNGSATAASTLSTPMSRKNSKTSERQSRTLMPDKMNKICKRPEEKSRSRGEKEAIPSRQLQLVSVEKLGNTLVAGGIVALGEQKSLPHTGNQSYGQFNEQEPAIDLEIDANAGRRKGRRTSSTSSTDAAVAEVPMPSTPRQQSQIHEMYLEEQLISAAFGENTPHAKDSDVPLGLSSESKGDNIVTAEEERAEKEDGHLKEHPPSRVDQKLLSRLAAKQSATEDSGRPRERTPLETTTPPKKTTTPKKMIKLRNDGKLASPKSNDEAGAKRKLKIKGAEKTTPRSKLVVLRYGSASGTGNTLGAKISKILKSEVEINVNLMSKTKSERTDLTAVDASKTTHPFFTSKPGQRNDKANSLSKPLEKISIARNGSGSAAIAVHEPTTRELSGRESWAGFGSSFSKPAKAFGALEAIWPPRETMHSRGLGSLSKDAAAMESRQRTIKKSKSAEMRISADEEILGLYQDSLQSNKVNQQTPGWSQGAKSRFPRRRLMTGPELQAILHERLSTRLPSAVSLMNGNGIADDSHNNPKSRSTGVHTAVAKLYKELRTSLSPFDRFECESQDWAHKYAPPKVAEVLQQEPGLFLLRDWLLSLAVTRVDNGNPSTSLLKPNNVAARFKYKAKRKRKQAGELDDFIVSSESETEITDGSIQTENQYEDESGSSNRGLRRLSPSSLKKTRAVIISGPHGCGKTASVYAAAQELGFEVFEINSGIRRNGKDVLDKVGDMTKNHLVRQLSDAADSDSEKLPEDLPDLQSDIDNGRQSTMQSFFEAGSKVKGDKKQKTKKPKAEQKSEPTSKKTNETPKQKQKQSLILLEEVDVLFEEDKQFWTTVLSLLASSKRPVIMTCTDESLLPMEEMMNCAVLRLLPSPQALAVDYLLLLAANEGHLLTSKDVQHLYCLHRSDLRAAIMQLQFYCQIGIGDTRGGLDWMLIRSNSEECCNKEGEALRVVSEGTFIDLMGTIPTNFVAVQQALDDQVTLLQEAHNNWDFDVQDWMSLPDHQNQLLASAKSLQPLEALRSFEDSFDALSAADIMPGSGILDSDADYLDVTMPPLTAKDKSDYLEGTPVLYSPTILMQSPLALSIVLSLKLLSHELLLRPNSNSNQPLEPTALTHYILTAPVPFSATFQARSQHLNDSLYPLGFPSASTNYHTALLTNHYPNVVTLPIKALALDIAPFCRSIAHSDLRLEADRLRLSQLLSEGGGHRLGSRKKMRTTRASRAALEGGLRKETRKERWWKREVGYSALLRTAGTEWGDAAISEEEEEKRNNGGRKVEELDGVAESDREEVDSENGTDGKAAAGDGDGVSDTSEAAEYAGSPKQEISEPGASLPLPNL